MPFRFCIEPDLTAEEFQSVLVRSALAARRPADDLNRLNGMLRNADLILTCRDENNLLIGISRAITDFHYCTYLSDLAVDEAVQKQGIGRELIDRTHAAAGLHTMLVLLAAPAARAYYPHIGMESHDSCWIIRAKT